MEKIWNVIQHSVVDGEHLINVTPCADYDVARAVMIKEVNVLLNESPKFKDAKRYITDDLNQELSDEDWDNCPYEWENENDDSFYIQTLYGDYSETLTIEEKDIKHYSGTAKKYWLINVSGHDGYSMMIYAEVDTEEQAINAAADADLFRDSADAGVAVAEEADEASIKHFKHWNLINEI